MVDEIYMGLHTAAKSKDLQENIYSLKLAMSLNQIKPFKVICFADYLGN